MKSAHGLKLLPVALVLSGCFYNCTDPICTYYSPISSPSSRREVKESEVAIQYCEPSQISGYESGIRSSGGRLLGVAKFDNGFSNFHVAMKKQAASVGATRVVYTLKKKGKAVGDHMVLGSATAPSVGISTTNAFGTISGPYGSSSYSGNAIRTTYNPGQQTYFREEFVYDVYEFDVRFYQ